MKIKLLKGYKYELMQPNISVPVSLPCDILVNHSYISLHNGLLTVYQGYCWDGATGVPDNIDNLRASLFHDALYQLMRLGLLDRKHRDVADRLFQKICLEDGMSKNWADLMYKGLKAFGEGSTKPQKHPKGDVIEILTRKG